MVYSIGTYEFLSNALLLLSYYLQSTYYYSLKLSLFIRGIVHDKNIDRNCSKWKEVHYSSKKAIVTYKSLTETRNMPFNYRKKCILLRERYSVPKQHITLLSPLERPECTE